MQKAKALAGILLLILFLGVMFYFAPWIFTGQNTLLTANQINIASQGYESGGQVKGSYWSLLLSASMTDQVGAYIFDDSDVPTGTTFNGKDVQVKSSIKIEIDPGQPYYERSIIKENYEVVPSAYRNWMTATGYGRDKGVNAVPALKSNDYRTSTSTWELRTPYTIKVYKDGSLVGQTTMDLFGSGIAPNQNIALNGKEVKIGDTANYVSIENLGALQQSYNAPNWASVIGWSNQYMYIDTPDVEKAMHSPYPLGDGSSASTTWMNSVNYDGTYAWYWYGKNARDGTHFNWYWRDDGTPCPIQSLSGLKWYTITDYDAGATPGWIKDASPPLGYIRVNPVQAVIFPNQEQSGRTQYYSLTEYLEQVVKAQKIGSIESGGAGNMPSWEPNVNNVKFNMPEGKIRIYMPFQSYNPLLVVRISTELANTIVWEPPVGNFKITAINGQPFSGGITDLGSLGDRKSVSVTIQNQGDVAASGTVQCVPAEQGVSWAFEPNDWGTGTMQPNEEKTFIFDVVDLTTTTEGTHQFTVKVYNNLGTLTDSATFKVTLLPRGTDISLLYIRAVDQSTKLDVSGVHIVLTFNDQAVNSKEGITPATFDFSGATPYVTITAPAQSVGSTEYKECVVSRQLSGGTNTVVLNLEPVGYTPFNWTLILLIIGIVMVVIFLVALVYYARKKRRR